MPDVSVNLIEAAWILVNVVTLVLTLTAYHDARTDRTAVRLLNGKARELAATGIVRREGGRVIVQALLLGIALPGLFSDREVALSPVVLALMAIPVILFLSSAFDARDRKLMTVLVTADVLLARNESLDRIEGIAHELVDAVADNTRISQEASDHADKAYHEANSVNEKIAAQGEVLVRQGDQIEARQEVEKRVEATIDTTAEQVGEIHTATVETAVDGKAS